MIHTENTAELNLLWGSLILEELARLGVQHICMAPGSRSTPLTLAAAKQTRLTTHVHFDERGLGFLALGLAKASQAPVAIITTSGTAVANLYPAVVEAWLTQIPLIVLSGDRPSELQGCGANQAIVQPAIFANYAKQLNLPTPDFAISPSALLTSIDELVANQTQPVHINCMYREPLYPSAIDKLPEFSQYLSVIDTWQQTKLPYTCYGKVVSQSSPTADAIVRFAHGKGVIVVGAITPEDQPQQIIELAQKLGWPILTDAQSQLRQHPSAIGNIDQLLLQPKATALLKEADRVLVIGGRFLSKRLIAFLAEHHWHSHWQVLSHPHRLDPNHSSKQIWQASVSALCALGWPRSSQANWATSLASLNDTLNALFERHIDQGEFGEAQVIRAIAATRPLEQQLFIGNSLPIRLYDMFAPTTCCPATTYTNRGASGIDGILATACGIASHQGRATTLVFGDISAMHDLNSLALARRLTSTLVIVILNNDGGNIFNILPVPNEAIRDEYYRLSHGFTFGYGATMFGLHYDCVDDLQSFNEAYNEALAYNGASVIEVSISQNQASEQIATLAAWVKQA